MLLHIDFKASDNKLMLQEETSFSFRFFGELLPVVTAGEGLITNVDLDWLRGSDLEECISTQRTCQWKENTKGRGCCHCCGVAITCYLVFLSYRITLV